LTNKKLYTNQHQGLSILVEQNYKPAAL
jgi:hypothetical protein